MRRGQSLVIDIQTLIIAQIAIAFALSGCVLVVAIGRSKELFFWAWAFALHGLSYLLISLRGVVPDLFSVVLANMLIASMLALFTEGIYRFDARRSPKLLIWWPVAAIGLSFPFLLDDFNLRVVVSAAVSVYQTGFLVWCTSRDFKEKAGQGKWIIIFAAIISTAMFVFRAVVAYSEAELLLSITSSTPAQSVTFLGATIAIVMFAFGLLVIYMERAEQTSLALALRDPLTQLGNRRVLQNVFSQLQHSPQPGTYSALLMIDLDRFKPLNDAYGHALGDQLLVEVAYRVKESVKGDSTIVRLGGDEFVVLFSSIGHDAETAKRNAAEVAEHILAEVAKPYQLLLLLPVEGDGEMQYECTCSIGISLFRAAVISSELVLEQADVAMYQAKQLGRNRFVFFNNEADS